MQKTYTEEEKLTLLKQYLLSGKHREAYGKEVGVTGATIGNWLRKYNYPDVLSINTKLSEMGITEEVETLQSEIVKLRKEKQQLEKQLQEERWRLQASELLIDLAERTYHIKVRKNSDAK